MKKMSPVSYTGGFLICGYLLYMYFCARFCNYQLSCRRCERERGGSCLGRSFSGILNRQIIVDSWKVLVFCLCIWLLFCESRIKERFRQFKNVKLYS